MARRISGVGRVTVSLRTSTTPSGIFPASPTPAGQIFPSPSPHTPARFAQDRSHPVAAAQETIPLPARFPPSVSRAAPPAIARSVLLQHKPLHGGHSPIARFLKTNAHPHQIPGTVRAANISGYAAIQIPASPSSKSRSDDIPPRPAPPAPSHKTPPSHLRSALLRRCTSLRPAAIPCRAGCLHQSPANKPKRAPAPAPPIPLAIAASFLSFGVATLQSGQS